MQAVTIRKVIFEFYWINFCKVQDEFPYVHIWHCKVFPEHLQKKNVLPAPIKSTHDIEKEDMKQTSPKYFQFSKLFSIQFINEKALKILFGSDNSMNFCKIFKIR